MKEPDIEQSPDPFGEGGFAAFIRKLEDLIEAREAVNPTPPPPPDPWVDKPGSLIAAEKELSAWELIEKLQPVLCGGPERCERARCQRARLCSEIESIKPLIEEARATLARERAKRQPPQDAPVRPARRRRRAT